MEIFNKLRKTGSTKGITTFIYILLLQCPCVIGEDVSSGMDETTTYKEPSTYITLTPIMSTYLTTSSPVTISTTFEPSTLNTTVFLSTVTPDPTTVTTDLTTIVTTDQPIPSCTTQPEFLASGPNAGDTLYGNGDDNFIVQCPSIEVPINSQDLGCFFLSSNGYITNGDLLPYTPSESQIDKTRITLMPLWADIDVRHHGHIYYQIVDTYDTTNKIQTETSRIAIKTLFDKYGQTNFNPVWAIKITWDKVVPFQAYNSTETITFQFILATDGAVTNMAYIYDDCQSSWQKTRMAVMGYSYPGFSYYHRDSMTEKVFHLGTSGNTQQKTKGVWIFELSKQYTINYAQKCLDWTKRTVEPIRRWAFLTVSCPCTYWQAIRDTRFSLGLDECFYLTFPSFGYSKVCCYIRPTSFWQTRSLMRGNLQFNSPILFPNEWKDYDSLPYTYCCLKSEYCSLYNKYRYKDDCTYYEPPIRRFTFGDPHIQTLDGFQYTFNGLGEFELLNIYNATDSSVLMKIQCRTKKVGQGGLKATVFSGFAIQSGSVTVQINTRQTKSDVEVFGNDIELTSFYKHTDYTWSKDPFYVSHLNGDTTSYVIRHSSQTILEISLKDNALQFSINVGYNIGDITTNGLLGVYNNNTSDDLKTPKGNVISDKSTEEEIYYTFGLLWKVNSSIFHYESGEAQSDYDFPNFKPSFLTFNKTSAEYKKAVEVCTATETNCIYDYLITKSAKMATDTKEVDQKIKFNNQLAQRTSPVFNGTDSAIATINKKLVHKVGVTGNDQGLQLEIVHQDNCNISFANKEVQVSVELNSVIPVKASFQVSNMYNMSTSLFNLTVMICPYCNSHGKCNTSAVSPTKNYEYVCDCEKGWRGPHCDVDARCDPLGCTCTGPNDNYTCDCPKGYKFAEKCVDINECTASPCAQICTNTIGSYKCSCNKGYTLSNGTDCVNLDECALSLHNCEQLCKDTNGSYECACHPGYVLNGTAACAKGPDVCGGSGVNCSKADGCTLINTKPTCFCKAGYLFNDTTEMCGDINECANITCIDGTCENNEGSYVCKCPAGRKLAADGRTCEECGQDTWGVNCANTCSGANCVKCNKTNGCVCSKGYRGPTCDIDIDECKTPGYCNATISTCNNTAGSAICVCHHGFIMGSSNGKCVDIDECSVSTDCSKNALCVNTFGSYTCKCKIGYEGDGKNCTDIDECARKTHTCDHNCHNQEGSFSCTCSPRFILQDDRVSCKANSRLDFHEEHLYMIIIGLIAGSLIVLLFIGLWCYFFGCGCRRKRETYVPTLDSDRFYLREAFGSVTSSLKGKHDKDPLTTDSGRAARYLQDWGHFSPYSENNKQDVGIDNQGWEDFGETSSSWGHVFSNIDNTTEFRIERPRVRP